MPDAHECAELLLSTVPNLMRGIGGELRQKLGDDELPNMGQLRMLAMLHKTPFSLGELASRHHVTPSTMSRTVDVLVRRNWVTRQSAPDDRRQLLLSLTDAGQIALTRMHQRMIERVAQMLEQLGDDERARLYDGLNILRTLLERSRPTEPDDCRAAGDHAVQNEDTLRSDRSA